MRGRQRAGIEARLTFKMSTQSGGGRRSDRLDGGLGMRPVAKENAGNACEPQQGLGIEQC